LFSWKNSHFGNKLTNEFSCFFSPPTTPFYVKLKKYRVHNAALKIHFPPMKTLLHFHFPFKYIFIFSGKFLSWHVFVQQKHSHSSTLEHIKIYLFLPLRGGIEFGVVHVWMMYGCVNVS
jgi:hypothetical protein